MLDSVLVKISDYNTVIARTNDHRNRILVATAKNLRLWKVSVVKMRSTYEVMNCFSFDITAKCLIAECWMANRNIGRARTIMVEGSILSNTTIPSALSVMETDEVPPTFNLTNKVTYGFKWRTFIV